MAKIRIAAVQVKIFCSVKRPLPLKDNPQRSVQQCLKWTEPIDISLPENLRQQGRRLIS
jgi:hypothetical protein